MTQSYFTFFFFFSGSAAISRNKWDIGEEDIVVVVVAGGRTHTHQHQQRLTVYHTEAKSHDSNLNGITFFFLGKKGGVRIFCYFPWSNWVGRVPVCKCGPFFSYIQRGLFSLTHTHTHVWAHENVVDFQVQNTDVRRKEREGGEKMKAHSSLCVLLSASFRPMWTWSN